MALVKIGRLTNSPSHEDSWTDLCGYAALGGEIATADLAEMDTAPVTVDRLTEEHKDHEWAGPDFRYRWRDGKWELSSNWNPQGEGYMDADDDALTHWGPFTRIS
jgi:hypothetical protein